MDAEDEFLDKALEGFALFAFNKGEVCTCPSRALIQDSIFDKFLERAVDRVARIKLGNPLDPGVLLDSGLESAQVCDAVERCAWRGNSLAQEFPQGADLRLCALAKPTGSENLLAGDPGGVF